MISNEENVNARMEERVNIRQDFDDEIRKRDKIFIYDIIVIILVLILAIETAVWLL